jgi:hypothetical protein
VVTFYSSSNAMLAGQPRDSRRGIEAPGSQGGFGRLRDTPGWCGASTPPVVHLEGEASAHSLTDQDINDRLVRASRTRQAAQAAQAQLAQAAGQSRGARC